MKQEQGFLLAGFEKLFKILDRLALGNLFSGGNHRKLETYILGWIVFEILLIILLGTSRIDTVITWTLLGILCYRLFEAFETNFYSVIILVMERKRVRSMPRTFVVALLNYIEVILIFGAIFYQLFGSTSIAKALNYSVSLATLSGASFSVDDTALYVTGIFEMLLGLMFIAFILGTIVNYLSERDSRQK
jgi:hypothetical protein